MKLMIFLLFISTISAWASPWVYFDLGDTLVDTSDKARLDYFEQVPDLLQSIQAEGYHLGLITNIPESWGSNYQEKLDHLKDYISSSWVGEEPFDWSIFDEIILPLNDEERKPAPVLFQRATYYAQGEKTLYVGESIDEIFAATQNGMEVFWLQDDSIAQPIFPTLERITYLLK